MRLVSLKKISTTVLLSMSMAFLWLTQCYSQSQSNTPIITTSSVADRSNQYLGAGGILSGTTIWHSQTPPKYPEWVEIQYSTPGIITKLSIKPQDGNPSRAPKNFVFQAGNDGKKWVDIYTVKDNVHKSGSDWHTWSFKNKGKYLYYRIFITGGGDPSLLTIQQIKLE